VSDDALYVYGVMPRAERGALSVAGVDGAEVGTVEVDGLAALTSRVHGDSLGAARELRAHWRVLQQACEGATVLPVRFGTVMENERAVRERLLQANAPHLDELLKRLQGCVQMTVKGTYREEPLVRGIVASSPALSALAKRIRGVAAAAAYYDRIRLGEFIAAGVADRRAADTQKALAALEPGAVAARAEEAAGALDAFNLAFLVKRTAQDDFSRRVRNLIDEVIDEIDVRYVGPLPPYSFADGELAAGGI
jgi:Gas vesicle synthesis protein GvpL/GvpF